MEDLEKEHYNIKNKVFNYLIGKETKEITKEVSSKTQVIEIFNKIDLRFGIAKDKSKEEKTNLFNLWYDFLKGYRYKTLVKTVEKIITEYKFVPTLRDFLIIANNITGTNKSDIGQYDNY